MNKKKVLLSVLALILVCAMTIVGTVAYMKNSTGAVTNTFIAAGGGKLADGMTLTEHLVAADANGDYFYVDKTDATQEAATDADKVVVQKNSYTVMPGMTLPKDPTITITGKTAAPAYLILEVINELPAAYNVPLESAWKAIMNGESHVTGNHGGKLYVYNDAVNTETGDKTYGIIVNNEITVSNEENVDLNTESKKLEFYAYLAQANAGGEGTPLSAYNACFPAAAPNP